MNHIVTLTAQWNYVRAECSCGNFTGESRRPTLDDLNAAVHEHIESSDRGTETDAVTAGHGGYRAESSVRSADELVDLEHP